MYILSKWCIFSPHIHLRLLKLQVLDDPSDDNLHMGKHLFSVISLSLSARVIYSECRTSTPPQDSHFLQKSPLFLIVCKEDGSVNEKVQQRSRTDVWTNESMFDLICLLSPSPCSVWAHAKGVSTEHALLFWNLLILHLAICLLPPRRLRRSPPSWTCFGVCPSRALKQAQCSGAFTAFSDGRQPCGASSPDASAASLHSTKRKKIWFLICKCINLSISCNLS